MMNSILAILSVPLGVMVSSPAPIMTITRPAKPEQIMTAWLPGEVRCGGAVIAPDFLERPLSSLTWRTSPAVGSLSYAFDIGPSGRTVGIRQIAKDARVRGSEDVAPSLAATRFSPGSPHSDCTIVYVPRQTALAETPVSDLMAYSVNRKSGKLPKEGWKRIYSSGDCRDKPLPGLQNRAFPNFRSIPATPGVRSWSMVGYDIDAAGGTTNIQTLAGTRNTALDAAARKAIDETRYYAGARTGCRYPYWRSPATLAPPSAPEEEEFRPVGATCPERRDWVVQPNLRYPETYQRRAIEGWAIVTYDVAPWGEIANVQVAASQPTEDFGIQAVAVVRGAKLATTQGFVGCVDRVKFTMASKDENEQDGEAAQSLD